MASFEKSNWNWQVEQFQRRTGEWLELNFFPAAEKTIRDADWSIADWFVNAVIWLAWAMLGLAIAWTIWQLYQIFRPYLESIGWVKSRHRTVEEIAVAIPATEWQRRSLAFARTGDYREACRALYMAMLQRLHEATPISHQPSRTDGEYLQMLRQIPQWQTYQAILSSHEQLCFNNDSLSAIAFDQCQQAYQELDRYLNTPNTNRL